MSKKLITPMILTALTAFSVNASAEGLADQKNEKEELRPLPVLEQGSTNAYQAGNPVKLNIHAAKLRFTAGEALQEYPDLTAQQRKYLVFGSN